MRITPRIMKFGINLWPPFIGAGIRVRRIAPDWGEIDVALRLGLTNRNYVGVHFGGSLYAMTDPFFMLMLMHRLGRPYFVWDSAGRIEYLKPARGTVVARFSLDDAFVARLIDDAAAGDKVLPELAVDIVDDAGDVVARVHKTLYVRLKPEHRPR
ncbi:DUF4442 domain-containing protein [Crenobacter cavernae]|uniref:DUF4442 domain-containing protein n=1 Tax=Crenobacter cavernae TaxID=2290923 RepID=A0ABY0FH61_9NEIS|nr:DUF4442 domain-containing protein [Crenobacter cavernae]RXZ45655.1 DUF4442 domain-containing protein [Crenobacter cavernae]